MYSLLLIFPKYYLSLVYNTIINICNLISIQEFSCDFAVCGAYEIDKKVCAKTCY